jgi:hypothetical protein
MSVPDKQWLIDCRNRVPLIGQGEKQFSKSVRNAGGRKMDIVVDQKL